MNARGAHVVAEGLGFAYEGADRWALSGAGLSADPGDEIWVTGPNASGKSTFLGLLAGVMPKVVGGHVAGTLDVRAEADDHAAVPALVMQDSGVYLFRSVHDELAFPLLNAGRPPGSVGADVLASLGVLGIEKLEGRLMHTLSGGERQKVAVAAALAVRPDLLLLDEPFEQLDPVSVAEVLELARERAAEGVTLFVATREGGNTPEGAERLHLDGGRRATPPDRPEPVRTRRPPSPGDAILELEGVTHRYGSGGGVEGIDLVVRAGEAVALLGPNGAGKTTLMKHTDGLLRPQSGSVTVRGRPTADVPVWELARTVGLLFQNPDDSIFNRRVDDEVGWGLTVRGLGRDEARRAAIEVLEELGIEALAARNPHETTSSERQLVALAAVLVTTPKLIVLDEPTKALDARATDILCEAIDRRLADGAGVLLVTHDPGFARVMSDRSVVLADGRVVAEGPTAELLADAALLRRAGLAS